MRKIRYGIVMLGLLLCCSAPPAQAGISIGIGLPNLQIGINLPLFPDLVPVPGYPVYYAPRVDANYFFYDGMYWVYLDDSWYASYWYNGPWSLVDPYDVPLFILRIPVRYYRHPPPYFRGWRRDAPPRWGEHWGREWEQRHHNWDRWNRRGAPSRAPLPSYQRSYSGDRYPAMDQQRELRRQHYRYQPRSKAVREHFRQQGGQPAAAPVRRQGQEERQMRKQGPQEIQRPAPYQPAPQQRGPTYREERRPQAPGQYERQAPRPQGQEQRGQGQWQKKDDERERGRER
ncbi:hypothetical protein GURASL_35800 [Geotalea uraniireducens]|uniref:Uncharacterized protein n=1 Tax=Geotalea uraniireducens TaxID=351604 RepID=A0ABM8EQX0_9BACT|nr:hypothetical protein [Geotalea uraniireducens]BDV44657.1 hypothetical protein GURASL_35800 [Geotalea uraniireducens]